MPDINDYFPPLIDSEKISFKKIKNIISDVLFALPHSLSFHMKLKEPKKELPEITNEDDCLYETAKEIYEESFKRIDKLEEKAFKLLSYYTILLGGVSYVLAESDFSLVSKIFLGISFLFIIWSIIISFRCLNIKGIQHKYISDIYDFKSDPPKTSFSKKSLIKTHLNSAIRNDRVADNVVDLHNAARYCLIISSIVFFIAISIAFINGELFKKTQVDGTAKKLELEIENISNTLERQTKVIDYRIQELKVSLDTLSKSLLINKKQNINKK